jgi:cyclic pyranopterin phosphate synthase
MLTDRFERKHDYLRISLTDACNIRCTYCMPEHAVFTAKENLMRTDELLALANAFVGLGVRKVRLTGGEPLVRPDFPQILRGLNALRPAGLEELTMTTNGIRLHEVVGELEAAGLRSVNVSLDTLMPDRFRDITRRDHFHRVLSNIHLLLDRHFRVKVNMVVMKGVNDDEVLDFVGWTRDYPLHVRFIEYMPFEGNRWTDRRLVSNQELLEQVNAFYSIEPLERKAHDTARGFRVLGHSGTFAFISTMSAPFCGDCNRLRLTADGRMKNCLFSKGETDLLSALRRGELVEMLIRENILGKAAQWGGQDLYGPTQNRSMVSIGG